MTPPAFSDAVVVPSFGGGGTDVAPPVSRAASWAADLSRLTRPRIAVMVLATVVTALWLTGGRPDNVAAVTVLLVGTALVAASSSIANQILERSIDRRMPRTADRPLAAGRLGVRDAWSLTVVTLVAGSAAVWVSGGWQPMAAAVATWLLYVLLYTPLKQTTPLNTAVGAVAGALPVAIGWLAAGGPARLWRRSSISGSFRTSWRSRGSTVASTKRPA
mgnify:CR=1 FL=1